ncbi:MAG: hypothetical protein AB8B56_16775 [Crocinitomicaceae bacterium]
MKQILLSVLLALFSFGSFASNKICVGENIIVVLNEKVKRLTVHDRASMEIIQSTHLEGDSFGEIALSTDGSKIWFQIDDKMYCRAIESGEILKEMPGGDSYTFDFSASMDYLIHYQTIDEKSLIYVYDLNTAEAISYAKVDSKLELETAHYDHNKQLMYVLSETYPTKKESTSKEPQIGGLQSIEQIELEFLHDQEEMRYIVYDIQNKKALHDEWLAYSPDGNCDFELINGELFLVSGIGTAKVLEDFSFKLTNVICVNQKDHNVYASELIGVNGYLMYTYSPEKGTYTKYDDFEANLILLEADGIAITETELYCIREGIFYRFRRDNLMGVDYEIALD